MKNSFKMILITIIVICLMPICVSAKEYGELFKKITEDGTYIVNAIEPDNNSGYEILASQDILSKLGDFENYHVEVAMCNWVPPVNPTDDYTCELPEKDESGYYEVEVYIFKKTGEKDNDGYPIWQDENDTLRIKFGAEIKENAKKRIDEIASRLNNKNFIVSDLGYISYVNSIKKDLDETDYINNALLYSNDFLTQIGNKNITYKQDSRAGDAEPWNTLAFGFTTLYYDGIGYSTLDKTGPSLKNILYIPDDTVDTDEAYIEAAMKRINDFLGKDNGISISKKAKLSEALDSAKCSSYPYKHYECIRGEILNGNYNGTTNKLDSIYEVTTKVGNKYYILIEKDSSKMTTPKFSVVDEDKNISISSNDGSIPLDTIFFAKYVTEGEDYNIIKSKINGDFTSIDLKLYSTVRNQNITKTENGKFIVSVPVPENLNGKDITVYYVTSSGELEEHSATVENGIASFETDHFSIYTIAEKIDSSNDAKSNPKTSDTIMFNVITLLVSGILSGVLLVKRKNN